MGRVGDQDMILHRGHVWIDGGQWVGSWVVFFQAEDGIRDLVRSRGLGDVYKRQVMNSLKTRKAIFSAPLAPPTPETFSLGGYETVLARSNFGHYFVNSMTAVSYTHLTLPTSDLV